MAIETNDTEPTPPAETPIYTGDALLNLLIHFVHRGVKSNVTLYTSGLVFSGSLLSFREYLEKNIERSGGPGKGLAALFEELLSETKDPNEGDAPDYSFVHLEGRNFVPGEAGMPENSSLMRIRREDVVGWSLGSFSVGQAG